MKRYGKVFILSVYIGIVIVMVLSVLLVITGVKNFLTDKEEPNHVLDDYFSDISPVMKTETNGNVIRPYLNDKVKVLTYFYDYKSDDKKRESSIINFKNTYLQNTGVDYYLDEDFDVISIMDGEIESIEDSELYGKVVTIKHNDNLKTIYSNIKDVLVNVGYKISQGEIFASSDNSKIYNDDKSILHFEVNYKNENIDPENLYTLKVSELE